MVQKGFKAAQSDAVQVSDHAYGLASTTMMPWKTKAGIKRTQ
jgi:hypothetical protein